MPSSPAAAPTARQATSSSGIASKTLVFAIYTHPTVAEGLTFLLRNTPAVPAVS